MPKLIDMAFAYIAQAEFIECEMAGIRETAPASSHFQRQTKTRLLEMEEQATHARGLALVCETQVAYDDMGLDQFESAPGQPGIHFESRSPERHRPTTGTP